ncbi:MULTISPECIES: C4-dicarboxylate TRAP transporter substrate-binding protein [unclassified Paenibacillus]|uniref:C4-dicarboxylate TRAP transporter substrate-binding protein n=1 Tax=unclassified Paenibacillus TaxID=185978 RepID=UPI0036346695
MKLKKASWVASLSIIALSLITAGCGGATATKSGAKTDKYVIKIGTVQADNEPINVYAKKLADSVKQRTDGKVEIQLYPNSSLGNNKETFEQALAGAPVVGSADPSYMQDYVPDFGVLNGPYIVDKPEDFDKVLKSEWFKGVSTELEKKGLKVLAFNWYYGDRHIVSKKEIRKPSDLKGVKFRIPPSQMWKETFSSLGATPTELQFSEVYTGMSSGVIDAAEAPLSSIYNLKFYENAKIISMTSHFRAITGMVMGKKYFDSLPTDIQKILLEEFEKFGAEESKFAIKEDGVWKKKLEDAGAKFVTDVDVAAFKDASKVTYTKFNNWTPGLYDKVQKIIKE